MYLSKNSLNSFVLKPENKPNLSTEYFNSLFASLCSSSVIYKVRFSITKLLFFSKKNQIFFSAQNVKIFYEKLT